MYICVYTYNVPKGLGGQGNAMGGFVVERRAKSSALICVFTRNPCLTIYQFMLFDFTRNPIGNPLAAVLTRAEFRGFVQRCRF